MLIQSLVRTKFSVVAACLVLFAITPAADAKSGPEKRLDAAASILEESLDGVDRGIPSSLLDRAHCVGVFPSVFKGALLIGGRYGKGVVTCRVNDSSWSAPVNFKIEGGNVGLQVGGSSTDIVLVFLGRNGVKRLMRTGFTIGVDGGAAAGPVGRTVSGQVDALFGADIATYSRSRGLFVGVSLDGATLRPAHNANEKLYAGWGPYPKRILEGEIPPTHPALPFLDVLRKYSPERRVSD
jgi:lipid-binding SYLF domain-containing protein